MLQPGAGRAGSAAVLGGAGPAAPCQAGGDQAVQALEVRGFLCAMLQWLAVCHSALKIAEHALLVNIL